MDVINPLFVSIAFGLAAALKLFNRQSEHFFSRLIISIWYGYVYMHPELDIETQRLMGRGVVFLLAFVECLSYVVRAWYAKKYNNAVRVKHADK
jgi:hypothetical protein